MDPNVLVAAISAGGSIVVAVTALVLTYRGFNSIDSRFGALESSVNSRFTAIDNRFSALESSINNRFTAIDNRFNNIEHRLEIIEQDMKQFYKLLNDFDKRLARVEDKIGLQ